MNRNITIVLEKTSNGYSAYVPDLPGCVAAGDTPEETRELLRKAIRWHLEALMKEGQPVPAPSAVIETLQVAV